MRQRQLNDKTEIFGRRLKTERTSTAHVGLIHTSRKFTTTNLSFHVTGFECNLQCNVNVFLPTAYVVREEVIFSVCLSVHIWGGVPHPADGGGGTPSQVQVGGYPIQLMVGGYPGRGAPPRVPLSHPGLGGGLPGVFPPSRSRWGAHPGYPPSRSRQGPAWGTLHPGLGGGPPGVPPHPGLGRGPTWGTPHPGLGGGAHPGYPHPGLGGGPTWGTPSPIQV